MNEQYEFLSKAIRVMLSIFFVIVAGLLFWQGFNPIFEGLDAGMSFAYVFLRNVLMVCLNIVGAIFCLFYAIMPWLSKK